MCEKLLEGPLLVNRTVILVTHHVELVVPAAHYLVRMLDGRIDTQGSISDLRSRGLLEEIAHDESIEVHKQEQVAEDSVVPDDILLAPEDADKKFQPRQLVKEEHREEGGVKGRVYKEYLEASSYWVWSVVALVMVINQFCGVGEKLWINVCG